MKKAVADLAPTLPVKVISFSNKSAFYADFSHDMYVSGDVAQSLRPRGINFAEINARGSAGHLCLWFSGL
jgi:hypothetical protein